MALEAGEPFRISRAMAWEASHVAMVGRRWRKQAMKLLDRAEELARDLDPPEARPMVTMSRSVAAFFLGEFRDCRRFADEAGQVFRDECAGVPWELDQCNAFGYWSCYWLGDLVELARRQATLLKASRDRGARLAESQLTTFGGPFVWLAADDATGAREAVQRAMAHWQEVEYQVYHYTALTANTQIDLYEGDGASALARMRAEWPCVARALLLHVEIVKVYMLYLRARCALATADDADDPEPYRRIAAEDARALARMRPVWARGASHQIRAALAFATGDLDRAVRELGLAVEALEADDLYLFSQCARYRRGHLVGGDEGASELAAVRDWMQAQGIRDPEKMAGVHAPGFKRPR
jgi:hypothetical protein